MKGNSRERMEKTKWSEESALHVNRRYAGEVKKLVVNVEGTVALIEGCTVRFIGVPHLDVVAGEDIVSETWRSTRSS